jgi:Excalibur calcium-binding domain
MGERKPKPTPKPAQEPKTDPRFGTCAEANARGYGPYTTDDLEYDWYWDRDGDGKVCEPK